MPAPKIKTNEVDRYIVAFPRETQEMLKQVRYTILKHAPGAEEIISYKMPAYKLNGVLAWFAGYKNHIGFYPGASGIAAFQKEISKYKSAKGSVQFPLDEPMPLQLIAKMIAFRVKEDKANATEKAKKKKAKK